MTLENLENYSIQTMSTSDIISHWPFEYGFTKDVFYRGMEFSCLEVLNLQK